MRQTLDLQALVGLGLLGTTAAVSIPEINGNRFLSPYAGQDVANVTGVVSAKGGGGVFLAALLCDAAAADANANATGSNGLFVYSAALAANDSIATGDVLVLSGTVSEYRSSEDYLPLTELTDVALTDVLGHGEAVTAVVLGEGGRSPPTEQYSALDEGDVFGVPNNRSLITVENPTLRPESYGLDFWESLVGTLVTVTSPRAVGKPNRYGDTWVVGTWATSDGNPEAILIGSPLDGSDNPSDGQVGDQLEDITGIVYQAYGFYRILPTTALTVSSSLTATPDPTTLTSNGTCEGITVGGYNIENTYAGDTAHIAAVAAHIVDYMRTPDLLAVQEIQDNDGETDDGVVDASETLSALASAVAELSGVAYSYVTIDPLDDTNGGAPGANIRNAYLYRGEVLRLVNGTAGGAGDAQAVLEGPALKYNPGLVDPTNAAFEASRKPLVAAWELVDGSSDKTLFTVNAHFGSKGGSSSLHGDARPPVNGGVDDRMAQMNVTAEFIATLLAADASAYVLAIGDFNEYGFVAPVTSFASISGLQDLDDVVGTAVEERYSYVYDMNSQELDHVFVSAALAEDAQFEHVHANSWVSYDAQISDHDPSVAKFGVCG
ncbi:DNase I-like protein [Xylariaceae sp. FL0016]|nr:DNase I-like protein [Xylariaceae sp. FL0016]